MSCFLVNMVRIESFYLSAVFQLPLVQNNTYAKVEYIGEAYSDPLHPPGATLNQ